MAAQSKHFIFEKYNLHSVISNLEGGDVTFVLSSGMAAISTSLLAFVKSGDHVIGPNNAYGGTYEVLKSILPRYGVETSFVDSSDISNYEKAIKPNTKVHRINFPHKKILYGETPSNPTVSLLDLKAFGELSKKHSILSMVDSTFASPYNQQPLKYGVDVVIHSGMKKIDFPLNFLSN